MALLLFVAAAAFGLGSVRDPAPAEKPRRKNPESLNHAPLAAEGLPVARLSRRHPATEAAKT
jgi:hypothetical protein